jgi:hypothetical protein
MTAYLISLALAGLLAIVTGLVGALWLGIKIMLGK